GIGVVAPAVVDNDDAIHILDAIHVVALDPAVVDGEGGADSVGAVGVFDIDAGVVALNPTVVNGYGCVIRFNAIGCARNVARIHSDGAAFAVDAGAVVAVDFAVGDYDSSAVVFNAAVVALD